MRGEISLAMLVKNEEDCVERAIQSVVNYVDECVFLDTGSTDRTPEICAKYGHVLRIVTDPMAFDFGEAYSISQWLATGAYVLRLDADETLSGAERLTEVIDMMDRSNYEAVSLPRRRWMDLDMTTQVEKDIFPDYQSRISRNSRRWRLVGTIHEVIVGVDSHPLPPYGPVMLEHFVDWYHLKDPIRAQQRRIQHEALSRRRGVRPEGSLEAMRLAGFNDAEY